MQMRRYRDTDLDAVIAVFNGAVRGVAARDYTPEQISAWAPLVADRAAWARRRASRPTWVAELDGMIAGFTDLEADGHLDMMFVHPRHQRQGIASALLVAAEAHARAQGMTRIFTEASITARPFFARRGFVLIAPQSVTIRGQTLTNYRMAKPVV